MASSSTDKTTITDSRTRDEPTGEKGRRTEPAGTADANRPPSTDDQHHVDTTTQDLQSVIDRYERLLDEKTRALERERERTRDPASDAGLLSRVWRWLRTRR